MEASQDADYRDSIKATAGFVALTLAWVASLALARFGPELWGDSRQAATWAAVVANLVVGAGWIVAATHFLRAIDELERKIMLDALAVTLGAGWVAGFGYVVADRADLVSVEAGVASLAVFMGVVFMIAVFVGKIRYR